MPTIGELAQECRCQNPQMSKSSSEVDVARARGLRMRSLVYLGLLCLAAALLAACGGGSSGEAAAGVFDAGIDGLSLEEEYDAYTIRSSSIAGWCCGSWHGEPRSCGRVIRITTWRFRGDRGGSTSWKLNGAGRIDSRAGESAERRSHTLGTMIHVLTFRFTNQ